MDHDYPTRLLRSEAGMDYRTIRVAPKGPEGEPSPVLTEGVELTPEECRVLGCLVEKAITTPDYYPLTLNSLAAACNQKTSRDPVVQYSDDEVMMAIDGLKEKHLATRITGADARVPRFRHLMADALRVNQPELAALTGYVQHRPNLGNFEGQCPSILFRGYPPDPIAAVDALRPDQQALLADYIGDQRSAGGDGTLAA